MEANYDNDALPRCVYKFTGKERDSESGLDNFGARYYASTGGRFMSPDWSASPEPVPYANQGDPQSLNLYSYVGNNPVARTDLDGHCDWHEGFDGCAYGADAFSQHIQVVLGGTGASEAANGIFEGENSINYPFGTSNPISDGCDFVACGTGSTASIPFTDPNPDGGNGSPDSPYVFHTSVSWPFIHIEPTPWYCHMPFFTECFVWYGNWGGPGYSGGQFKPLETLTPQQVKYLAPPIDAQDTCYQAHDWCYSDNRTHKRNDGPRSCDFDLRQCLHLINESGSGNAHSWGAEALFSECELSPRGIPCPHRP
jgi:RHS repeat-associated protein